MRSQPVSVFAGAVRLRGETLNLRDSEAHVKYALLAYNTPAGEARGAIPPEIAEVLARPNVKSWARLHPAESATTVSRSSGETLLTDGPFVDSKEYLGGLIIVEAANLDEALAVAADLQSSRPGRGAIEVRPIFEDG
jgi:hypothetical protein